MTATGHFQAPATGIADDPRLASRRLLIAYGSETGNSQDAAETLGRVAERLRFQTYLCEMNDVTFVSIFNQPFVYISLRVAHVFLAHSI